jgi:hypothetical protein
LSTGRIVREAKVTSEPETLIGRFRDLPLAVTRIGLEAGPLSQWLYAACSILDWRSECIQGNDLVAAAPSLCLSL